MTWPRRLRPHSLRGRLVLIASLLATCAVILCQVAGLTVLRSWLTDQVDDRLAHFRLPDGVYRGIAAGTQPAAPAPDDVLPSDYRVFFYGADGHLLETSLHSGDGPGPRLPSEADDLDLPDGRATTVEADEPSSAAWRVIAYSGPDRMRSVVALPLDTVDGATTKLLWFSLLLGVAVAAGVVVLGNAAVGLGLRPLTRVERTAQHITRGALELSVPVPDPDTEVGRLGLALNTMLDRLRAAMRRTEASEARMRGFMADAGHELRTPLTAIQGFAELLLQEPGMTDRRRQEAYTLIARNSDRMSRLVDDLFLLAKLGAAPLPHREPVDLLSLAADAIATTAVRHPLRSIGLEPLTARWAGGEHELDVVETAGDQHQLAQVLGNLLANACTHTPPETRIRVRVGAGRAGDEAGASRRSRHGAGSTERPGRFAAGPPLPPGLPVCVVEVADDGPGIRADQAVHVFDRFYRAEPPGPMEGRDTSAGPEPGSGLGLAIAAAIVEAHGGRLELDTRPGAGCVFRLLLPDPAAVPPTSSEDAHTRPCRT